MADSNLSGSPKYRDNLFYPCDESVEILKVPIEYMVKMFKDVLSDPSITKCDIKGKIIITGTMSKE